jgi:hypothetical protein
MQYTKGELSFELTGGQFTIQANQFRCNWEIHDRAPVQWDEFSEKMADRGEWGVPAVEMSCFEDRTVALEPGNDVIVAVVIVAWSASMISVMKKVGTNDRPVGHSDFAFDCMFRSIPDRCQIAVLLDSGDLVHGFHFTAAEAEYTNPLLYIGCRQWHDMYNMMKRKDIQGFIRKFDESKDEEFIPMRTIAIREAHETMLRGVSERHDPSTFLACGRSGRKPHAFQQLE